MHHMMGREDVLLVSSREIKHLNSGAKAPICQHFGESITGIVTIRYTCLTAASFLETFIPNIGRLESQINIRATYANYSANRWLGVSVNAIDLRYCMMILSRGLCDLEANFVAVERIKAYSNIPSKAAEDDVVVQPSWPSSGNITFDNYTTAYQLLNDDTSIQPVLRNLNLKIVGGEKIGMCGRSGAGKSTITLLLFRIIEAGEEHRDRRAKHQQYRMLFQGTVRSNFDPLGKHSDATVWRALVLVNLREFVAAQDGKLRAEVKTGSSNFSAGQLHLLTLTAALLPKQRTVIFDEHTIHSEFKDCTLLTIDHRIATIMDNDPTLVLDQGQVAEFDIPQVLLQNLNSAFAKLVEGTKAHGMIFPLGP
ncbi:hypothetical protein RI367_002918 [Sorochytrium milnesiophthora]